MIPATRLGYSFATTTSIAQKTFAKFTERHSAILQQFSDKVSTSGLESEPIKKTTQRAFVHPMHEAHKGAFMGVASALQAEKDLHGQEQVSAHYEHFSFARRHALIFFGGLAALKYIAYTEDFYMFARSAIYSWTFFYAYTYFYLEGKKYFLMPMLNRFYKKLVTMEMGNMHTYWSENIETRVRSLLSVAKSQMEYKIVHKEYMSIRNNTLLNYLINQQIALKNHIHSRAQNLLKEAESIENINQSKIIGNVMQETLQSIDKAYENNKAKIDADMFNLALEGIANGKMDYAKDPILPYVLQTINQTVEKFSKISKEDQEKLVCLNEDQFQSLRNLDARARDEYILNEPKIDGSLRNNPGVAKILSSWGK